MTDITFTPDQSRDIEIDGLRSVVRILTVSEEELQKRVDEQAALLSIIKNHFVKNDLDRNMTQVLIEEIEQALGGSHDRKN